MLPPPLPGLVLPLPCSCPCRSHSRPSDWQRESLSARHHLHHPGGPSLPAPGPPGRASAKHQDWAQRWVLPQWCQGKIPPGRAVGCCGMSVRGTGRAEGVGLCAATCPRHHPSECLAMGHQQQGVERAQRWGELARGKERNGESGARGDVSRGEMAKAGSALGIGGGRSGAMEMLGGAWGRRVHFHGVRLPACPSAQPCPPTSRAGALL